MIVDNISSCNEYAKMNERFALAFDFIKNNDLNTLPAGRYEVDGDKVYVMVVEDVALKTKEVAALEVHNKYIDIQLPISCNEAYGWMARTDCKTIKTELNEAKDIMFYADSAVNYIDVKPGEFVIFFPQDAHAPLVGEGKIKKCVIKVLV